MFLNAIANQLRYPNVHTWYFMEVTLHLFAESGATVREQISRFESTIEFEDISFCLVLCLSEFCYKPLIHGVHLSRVCL